MDKTDIIQNLLDRQKKTEGKTYLEIGIEDGSCFCKIIATRKIGVDPIPANRGLEKYLLQHPEAAYYQTPSNDFFTQKSDILDNQKIDVAFVTILMYLYWIVIAE